MTEQCVLTRHNVGSTQTCIHGDATRFAIEWKPARDADASHFQGHFSYWIGGQRFGASGRTVDLNEVIGGLRYPTWDNGNRYNDRFEGLNGRTLYQLLQAGMYEGHPALLAVADEEQWPRFDLTIETDVLGELRLFLVDFDECSLLLVGQQSRANPQQYHYIMTQRLEVGEADSVFDDTLYHLLLTEAQLSGASLD